MRSERINGSACFCMLACASVMLMMCALVSCRPAATKVETGPVAGGQPRDDRVVSHRAPVAELVPVGPHWSAEACDRCHGKDEVIKPIAVEKVDAICRHCHDGKEASAERHPVGRAFSGDQVAKLAGWPVVEGELACITCHDVRLGCDRMTPAVQRRNPKMLRGYEGGSLVTFCAACHVQTAAHERDNPHRMLTADGQVNLATCLRCHETDFSGRTEATREGNPQLRGRGNLICLGCHTRHIDYFEPGHLDRDVPDAMQPKQLPLDPQSRIACYTCHNPHAEGIFPADSVLGRGGICAETQEKGPRLRGLGKDVCYACHYQ